MYNYCKYTEYSKLNFYNPIFLFIIFMYVFTNVGIILKTTLIQDFYYITLSKGTNQYTNSLMEIISKQQK